MIKLFRRDKPPAPAAETAAAAAPVPPAESSVPVQPPAAKEEKEKTGLFARLRAGLGKTRQALFGGLGALFLGRKTLDDDLLEEIEGRLLAADVGVATVRQIVDGLVERTRRRDLDDPKALFTSLKEQLVEILGPSGKPLQLDPARKPFVILMVGVNGAGKTTTIGKLARRFQAEGRSVMLAAGDTFRAAAVEQLVVWGERNGVPVVAQHTGADSASVIFDALQSAQARGIDVLIADTAGRLHVKSNLMEELRKIVRVMKKIDPDAPHETLLVMDACTGQNGLAQARNFLQVVGVNGVALTKLDGTAKGGIVFSISRELGLPVRFIGIGEGIEDLRPFDPAEFVDALFDDAPA